MDLLVMWASSMHNRPQGDSDSMRIARTFTIDIDLAQELRRKVNQSETVNRALRKYMSSDDEFDLRDVTIRKLLAVLQSRFDQFEPEYSLIQTLIAMCKQS